MKDHAKKTNQSKGKTTKEISKDRTAFTACTNTDCKLRAKGCKGFEGCPGYKGR